MAITFSFHRIALMLLARSDLVAWASMSVKTPFGSGNSKLVSTVEMSTHKKLKKLDLDELSIADTAVNKKKPAGFTARQGAGRLQPYNSSPQVGGGSNPYDRARAMGDTFETSRRTRSREHWMTCAS
jgi:hypothetical protein